ncbi:MarR family winged helix-turn-helix transcriptional regulator [Catenuloplanes atrovinosus]|uniref:DNA-binding MarR family transcriptional regulator n=1 Tax=Catenuloplanes atrovinosus TaxID=137266 RepID=A0AAE4CAF9_9ACTN|nr:MarR family winged helix-turn-helix transcriptional regulator [Catenuloplanes atrovinosus]MDR7274575.1 DNA-binding MarR family transcriptional regulator [Catenuloplanes atrovinosus]
MDRLTQDEDAVWRTLAQVVHQLPRVLDEDMSRAEGLSMTEFAILRVLSEAPDHRLRMVELAAATALSPSRITRVVGDLARIGMVSRERHASDARGSVAALTDVGLKKAESADPAHVASARRWVLDHIDPADRPAVLRALRRIADGIVSRR